MRSSAQNSLSTAKVTQLPPCQASLLTDSDGLDLRVLRKAILAQFTANPALLEAAKGHAGLEHVIWRSVGW